MNQSIRRIIYIKTIYLQIYQFPAKYVTAH